MFEHSINLMQPTSVNDPMYIIKIDQPFENAGRDLSDDVDGNWTSSFVDSVKRALIHELHADANIGIRNESAVEGDYVFGVTVVHEL